MKHKKLFPLFIIFVLFLAACGGAGSYDDAEMMSSPDSDNAVYFEEAAAPPMEPQVDMAVDVEAAEKDSGIAFTGSGAMDSFDNRQSGDETAVQNNQERLIIRTGNMGLVVSDTEEAMADITHMVEQNGGWVVSANLYQYNEKAKSGEITMRVPASGFNSAMAALKEMAVKVQHENVSGQDVTEEFVDLEARLANLEATAVRVRAFLDEAETVEEALAVNQELSRLDGEIEVIKGRMKYLSQSAAYSTITVSLTPDIAAQPVQVAGWQPTGVAKEAVEALIGTLQGLATFAIWLAIYILPIALIIGVPAWLVGRFIWRRRRRQEEPVAPTPTD